MAQRSPQLGYKQACHRLGSRKALGVCVLVLHGHLPLPILLILAMWFRHFGNPALWAKFLAQSALGVNCGKPPHWGKISAILTEGWNARVFEGGSPVYSSLYRSRLQTHYLLPMMVGLEDTILQQTPSLHNKVADLVGKGDPQLGTAARVKRDLVSMACLYEAALHCVPACHGYIAEPGLDTYAFLYDAIDSEVAARTKGIFGDYGLKLTLDILICSGRVDSAHISKWPMKCDGYPETMKRVFPNLPRGEWFNALLFIYRELAGSRSLMFPSVIMHLCWSKRRESGMLDDRIA